MRMTLCFIKILIQFMNFMAITLPIYTMLLCFQTIMIKVLFNIVKSLLSLIFSIFRPLKRLWCRRLKTSEMDPGVPTVVGAQSMAIDMPQSFDNAEEVSLHI